MTATARVEKTAGLQQALDARGTERASREALACAWQHRALVARVIRRCLHHRNQISVEMDDLISIGVLGFERLQGVKGVRRALAVNFAGVHDGLRHIDKGQARHRQAMG